ncbi:MAG: hypothetical protein LBP79_01485 [Clostridiales bacterium]|nr:hypothetical protein [Clostridiales bacterium]
MLVIEKLGLDTAKVVDWSLPRVICVAGDFSKYDESAINQMTKSVSLIRYKRFGGDLLMFEKVGEHIAEDKSAASESDGKEATGNGKKSTAKDFDAQYTGADLTTQKLYDKTKEYILSLDAMLSPR